MLSKKVAVPLTLHELVVIHPFSLVYVGGWILSHINTVPTRTSNIAFDYFTSMCYFLLLICLIK